MIFKLIKGMKDVHNSGIIHRDLYLGNILIKNDIPYLTEKIIEKPEMQENGEKTIHLTIVLSK